jgi:hypothetical protein
MMGLGLKPKKIAANFFVRCSLRSTPRRLPCAKYDLKKNAAAQGCQMVY